MPQETPAAKAIRLLGAKRIAATCDLTTDAVWKWANQGAGRVPSKHQPAVLRLAQDKGVPLSAADLIGVA
ncbi:hypothetical protein [Phenylobacterium sp. SCN 70-31]|uniref:hypothetical protein n=1 Tax=Phenylobacterium sp. SCN 70-31 TaxID=1660129 RepID=UPI00086B494D|nr:hypothetical protein [Phenylobacterium sp. SCN 70-31]ODT88130.1 MAG: hypothetical protein ABS78_09570 [Phenylobacterium sp. SCN 70-31]